MALKVATLCGVCSGWGTIQFEQRLAVGRIVCSVREAADDTLSFAPGAKTAGEKLCACRARFDFTIKLPLCPRLLRVLLSPFELLGAVDGAR